MKKPGSSSSKAVPPFLHIKGIPHAALLASLPASVDWMSLPTPGFVGFYLFVWLTSFGFPLPSTGPTLTAPRQLSQGSLPSFPLSQPHSYLPPSFLLPSEPPSGYSPLVFC